MSFTELTVPSVDKMRFDMINLRCGNDFWTNFKKAYKTYMGSQSMLGHMSSDIIREIPEFSKDFYEAKELAFLDMYKIWMDVTRFNSGKHPYAKDDPRRGRDHF